MNRYVIHCCPGSAGLFLTSVFAKIMKIDVDPKFSNTGNCHDLGHGVWKGAPGAGFLGNYYGISYKPGLPLYYAHQLPLDFKKNNPDLKSLLIEVDPNDYRIVTTMYVKKAWPDLWTEDEYNKWKSPSYPPYSSDNIAESKLIVDDLVNDLIVTNTQEWFKNSIHSEYDYKINFRTILGFSDQALDQVVSDIVGLPTDQQVHRHVTAYQKLNQDLYFNDK